MAQKHSEDKARAMRPFSLPYNPKQDGSRRALCNAHASSKENKETESVKGRVIARDAPVSALNSPL